MESRRTFVKSMLAAGAVAAGATVAHFATGQVEPVWTGAGSLRAHAAARGLLTGMAVNVGMLDRDADYTRTVVEQADILVAENTMKWAPLRPAPDQFNFAETDRFMQFAAAHDMKVRGHNLCWHEQLPAWFAATANPGNAEQLLTTHIAAVAGRYRGRIRAWDVVNEAIDLKDGQPDGLRASPWFKLLGPRYVEVAFRAARAADPKALLTYNDYSIEADSPGDTNKRKAVLALLRRLRAADVPLDAVGIQSHLSAGSAAQIGDGLAEFLEQCQDLGLKVFVTELDVNDDDIAVSDAGERSAEVGSIYGDYLRLLMKHAVVTDVLTWGVSNRSSWLNSALSSPSNGSGANTPGTKFRPKHPSREELCLPFNDSYQPEPAFFAMRDAFRARKV